MGYTAHGRHSIGGCAFNAARSLEEKKDGDLWLARSTEGKDRGDTCAQDARQINERRMSAQNTGMPCG